MRIVIHACEDKSKINISKNIIDIDIGHPKRIAEYLYETINEAVSTGTDVVFVTEHSYILDYIGKAMHYKYINHENVDIFIHNNIEITKCKYSEDGIIIGYKARFFSGSDIFLGMFKK